jgi:RNA polymerase primary sigma factor
LETNGSEPEEELELTGDPEEALSAGEEQNSQGIEDTFELNRVELAAELSDDPVRLYLREIGQVKLLDAPREFRLAAMLEGRRVILQTMRRRRMGKKTPASPTTAAYHNLLSDLLTAWTRLREDASRLGLDIPDAALLLAEAHSLHRGWEICDAPSYLHSYIEREQWGKDPLWDSLVGHAYIVYVIFYILPDEYAGWLLNHIKTHHDLPTQRTLFHNLPAESDLAREVEIIRARADEANAAIIRANLRLVVRSWT